MAYTLDKLGPSLKLPWTRLKAHELTKKLRNKIVDGCLREADGREISEMNPDRDCGLVEHLTRPHCGSFCHAIGIFKKFYLQIKSKKFHV